MTERRDPEPGRRRFLLGGGALVVAGWVIGAPRLAGLWTDDPEFRPIPGLDSFRRLVTGGAVSGTDLLFLGLEDDGVDPALAAEVRRTPCAALYGAPADGPAPLAFFSDYRCPNCRVMEDRLRELARDRPELMRLVRHELPLLGPGSVIASRAALAARAQDAGAVMHDRLIRSVGVIDRRRIMAIAAGLDLDVPRLLADMDGAAIDRELARSRAVARVFGLNGTPAFAVGRTVFLGAIPTPRLVALIEDARAAGDCDGGGRRARSGPAGPARQHLPRHIA